MEFTEKDREDYQKAYYNNEADANKKMSYANAIAAAVMVVIWICYLTGLFILTPSILVIINISFPIEILVLLTPLFYTKFRPDLLRKKNYKYFVVFSFIIVVSALNIIIPKHTLLAWALCIIMTTHFYNQKLSRVTFIVVAVLMLLCTYGALFFGEYDPNLLGDGVIVDGKITYVDGVKERYEMLHQMLLEGENRYLKVFIYYYLPRFAIMLLIELVCNSLNKRTYKLFVDELMISTNQQKTKTELEVAKEIQLTTLPREFITNKDVEIQAELKAAKEVGGDFYDYFILDDRHVAIVIGDVSGKGIPAAMFMMKTITCFKNYINLYKSPSEIMKKVNRTIFEGNESKMFVTCFLAIIDTQTGEMKYSNAGHNHPIVGQNYKFKYLNCKSGFLLGVLPDLPVVDEEYQLSPGDSITLYTDGVTEAMNNKREQYGEKRLIQFFNKKDYSFLVELHRDLKDDIDVFVNGAEQSDDMTYLTLKYHGDDYLYDEQTFPGVKEKIPEMLDFIKKFGLGNHFGEEGVQNALVVANKLLSDIVEYGYKGSSGDIFLRTLHNLSKKEVILTIIDTGEAYTPFIAKNKHQDNNTVEDRPSESELSIAQEMTSEFAYDRINGKNILVIKKRYE